jgi:hypothetical protein
VNFSLEIYKKLSQFLDSFVRMLEVGIPFPTSAKGTMWICCSFDIVLIFRNLDVQLNVGTLLIFLPTKVVKF